ncbi:MAG: hypothetical protein AAF399_28735, partial [Bacteroidota bacterium]
HLPCCINSRMVGSTHVDVDHAIYVCASNLIELFQNLVPSQYLTPADKELYVPIYEQTLKDLRFSILTNPLPTQTFYVAGQTGTGKTTALNFLANEEIEAQFHVENIHSIDLLDFDDIHIIDLLLMTSYWLMKQEEAITGKRKLEKKFRAQLKRIEGKHQGTYQEETIGVDAKEAGIRAKTELELDTKNNPISRFLSFFNLTGSFAAEFRGNYEYRKLIREQFEFNLADLLNVANDVIQAFETEVTNGKPLLLIYNELDHIRDLKRINNLFIHKRYYLESLACRKVVSIPVYLASDNGFTRQGTIERFGLKTRQNPLAPRSETGRKQVEDCKELLRKVIQYRIAPGHDLVRADAIERAIEGSGGVLRQFVEIMHHASQRAAMSDPNGQITLGDVEEGVHSVRRRMEPAILGNIALLNHVLLQHTPPDEEVEPKLHASFTSALLGNQILIYYNDPAWYEVNPLLQRTVEIYARQRPERPPLT